ncbi:extracellular matrix organizing protein FRAS1-like [Diadema antillarum]|uniref:extracellular matrix organizing protein FRAS1-like n=1 Tax=Diadema antillarum TaxID=105358 RepID=UPI003A8B34F4
MTDENHTVWESDPCTLCSCLGEIVSCTPKQCRNPECDFTRGAILRISANKCCPECASSAGSCDYQGEIVGHNSQWNPSPCTTCVCISGQVTCRNQTCSVRQCRAGEVLYQAETECCPTCIRSGRTCTDRGVTHYDGEEWSPVKCAKCICNNGQSQCYIADCPAVTCGQDEEAVVPEGKCCPECVGRSCQVDGATYQDGATWKSGVCTHCLCKSGTVSCVEETCVDNLPCAPGETRMRRDGHCCSECVSSQATCEADGVRWYSGDMWNVTDCEFCFCQEGLIACFPAECARTECREGETLIHKQGRCCPECHTPLGFCIHNRITYAAGETWQPDPCRTCSCVDGLASCFRLDCPPCPVGTVPQSGPLSCCPQCVAVSESGGESLTNFQFQGPVVSLHHAIRLRMVWGGASLRDVQLLTQCTHNPGLKLTTLIGVDGFRDAMLANVFVEEAACHSISCLMGEGIKVDIFGEIVFDYKYISVSSRREGHFGNIYTNSLERSRGGDRLQGSAKRWDRGTTRLAWEAAFAKICNIRTHSRPKARLSGSLYYLVSAKMTGEMGAMEDGENFGDERMGDDNLVHMQCPVECLSCDAMGCTSCRQGRLLMDGQCVMDCRPGSYRATDTTCNACHESCAMCSGGTEYHCTSCHGDGLLQWGRCVADCGPGFFQLDGTCQECNATCATCTGPKWTDCLSCANSSHVIRDNGCVPECGPRYYLRDNHCYPCDPSCQSCFLDSPWCVTCPRNHFLEDGTCVRECSAGFYQAPNGFCEACSIACLSCSGPGIDQCTSCPRSFVLMDGYCLQNCSLGTFNEQGQCFACHSSCHQCEGLGPSDCTSCRFAAELVQTRPPFRGELRGSCSGSCLEGYFASAHGVCLPCNPSCLTCSDSSLDACLSCRSPLFLNHGYCVRTCDNHQVAIQGMCVECHPSCATCSGPEANQCTGCYSPDSLQGGTCSPGCGSTQYPGSLGLCQECDSACGTCFANPGGQGSKCTQCAGGGDGSYPLGDTCVSECGTGFYLDQTNMCQECHASCRTCTSSGVFDCTSCHGGHTLAHTGMCSTECHAGYFNDGGICKPCQENCIECESTIQCLVCRDPSAVLQFGECSSLCAEQYYLDPATRLCRECDWSCNSCNGPGPNDCTQCMDGLRLKEGSCVTQCGEGYYEARGECRECGDECMTCRSVGVCTTCHPPRLLLDTQCVMQCAVGYYSDYATHTCIECSDGCVECATPIQCVACRQGTYLLSGRCVLDCGDGYYANPLNNVCEGNIYPPTMYVNGSITTGIGGIQVLDTSFFTAFDPDTNSRDLFFVLVSPPTNGALIKNERGRDIVMSALDTFAYPDLLDGSIRYVHNAKSDMHGFVTMRVSDRVYTSEPEDVSIVIISPHAPFVTRNEPLVVIEGEIAQISTGQNLQIHDEDNPDMVVVSVIDGPKHGKLIRLPDRSRLRNFNLEDLRLGSIHYVHDGSETQYDALILQVSDGHNVLNLLFNIHIIPKDDRGPILVNNVQGSVREGGLLQISNDHLRAQDVDSEDGDLIFTLTPPQNNPRHGEVVMVLPITGDGVLEGWRDIGQGLMEKRLMTFRQRDIDQGYIYYRNSGAESFADYFMFEVSDVASPPNTLGGQAFNIEVMPSNDQPPHLVPQVRPPLGIMAEEESVIPILRGNLAFTDPDSNDRNIVYNLTMPLNPLEGIIENMEAPFASITHFTQADINAGKILYRSPSLDAGIGARNFTFHFTVTDGFDAVANTVGPFPFTIRVMERNTAPPVFGEPNPVLQVQRGGIVSVRPYLADVRDVDTALSQLVYRVTVPPNYGALFKGGFSPDIWDMSTPFTYTQLEQEAFHYLHDATPSSEDSFEITVDDGSHVTVLRAIVLVAFSDTSSPVVSQQASLALYLPESSEATVTHESLAFEDEDSPADAITIELRTEPQNGRLQRRLTGDVYEDLHMGSSFTQSDVNAYNIRYISEGEIGSQPVSEVLMLNVSDASGNSLLGQTFTVTVTPVNNQAPVVTLPQTMQVTEGGREGVTNLHLSTTDLDTRVSQLSIIMDTAPSFGYLENIRAGVGSEQSNAGIPISAFRVQDILDGVVYYVNNRHQNIEPVHDGFLFHVTDGENRSPQFRFNISIQLVNDEQPIIFTEQAFVPEGEGVIIANVTIFASDLDTPTEDLLFEIVTYPQHGNLRRRAFLEDPIYSGRILGIGDTFTYQDVVEELIIYIHDGSDVNSDTFRLSLTDGLYTAQEDINIIIGLVNDETPRLATNTGLRISMGSATTLTSDSLRATDIDSEDDQLLFTITADPNIGQLRFVKGSKELDLGSSLQKNTFKQSDINNGYVEYLHSLSEPAGTVVFKFTVSDPEGNQLIDQSFIITVLEDRIPPRILANQPLTVREGASSVIDTSTLSATDDDSIPGNLMYYVTAGPSYGRVEHSDFPGTAISQFSQADLAAGAVSYVHTSPEENMMDSFTFTVDDGSNQVTQTFYINISPVDDSLPLVSNLGMRVQEGVRKTITEFELKAIDLDTSETTIMFTVFNPPSHGTVDFTLDGVRFTPTLTFSMADIYENRISYNHDGTNTLSDRFMFTVSDGTNPMFVVEQGTELQTTSAPQVFEITVMPVDDGTPRIVTNNGLSYLEYVDDRAMGVLTSRTLQTMDADTSDRDLVYTVTSPPRHGYLESTLTPRVPVSTFTQQDIENGIIRYVLTPGAESETSDSFVFDVSDTLPNTVIGSVYRIRWSLIHFERAHYNVSETQGTISVALKRTGNINQYAIVLCRTEAATATATTAGNSRGGRNDYVEHAGQVQFEEREDTKTCTIIINDDDVFEGPEDFIIDLSTPAYALLGEPSRAIVSINDIEDEPSIEFAQTQYHVNESAGFLFAPVVRKGDSSSSVSAICFTIPRSATGSSLTGLESGSDYKTRGMSLEYQVVFPQGVNTASCDIKIIDDALYEEQEEFEIALSMPSYNTRIGPKSRADVIIDGPNDESVVYFGHPNYIFSENSGTVEIEVYRQGSDLSYTSMVWCAPKDTLPQSASPGQDYVPSANMLTFDPQQTVEICRITIVDDSASPQLEGNETFIVFLSSAMNTRLGTPSEVVVVINDTADDVPTMQFQTTRMTVEEKTGVVHVPVVRTGDISFESSVRCFTRQKTAQVMMDYDERLNTDDFRIIFAPGEKVKNCTVRLVEDGTYESDETFMLKLSMPYGSEICDARIGENRTSLITITDNADAPMLQFERMAYSVREPSSQDQTQFVDIKVVRTGDQNRTSGVRCSTRDGSAKSGVDYEPYSKVLRFDPGVQFIDIQVEILYNEDMEWHETFSIILGPDEPENALLGAVNVATVTVIDEEAAGSVVLPAPPVVVSLMDYDNIATALDTDPSPGYPLVCCTPCDPHFPEYSMTRSMCLDSGINISSIRYNWEVSTPLDNEGTRSPFERIVDSTPFTSSQHKVLDSIYFSRHFQVRCVAQPYDMRGRAGIPLRSNIVTIGADNGICHTPVTAGVSRGLQAQSFIANLRYIGPEEEEHPNTLHVSVEVPHQDGMLPIISTIPIHNIRFLLTEPVYRSAHICSNLVNTEQGSGLAEYSFLDTVDYDSMVMGPGYDYPYQFDPNVREEHTLRLYNNLNLKSCTWTFDAYYHMTELIDLCGGAVSSDFEVRNGDKSFLTVTVPLYVSYIYVMAPTGWASLDHRTEMEFSFFYSTILWRTGLETESVLSGRLQVLRIWIGDNGNLVIDFKTTTKFRGQFVINHHTLDNYKSRVVPPLELGVAFELELLWSEGTFDSPQQLWRATSAYNRKDYSGDYIIELIPCTATPTQSYNPSPDLPIVCTAHPPEKFVVPIAFQQTNRPVPVVYSLNTEFHLMNNEKVFMMNPIEATMTLGEMDYRGAFSKGQTIFGRVLWNPDQDLDRAYRLTIQKLFICTGNDGYVPYYDPSGTVYEEGPQFGCMQDNVHLKHRFLLLDRGNPDAVHPHFNDVPFDATFAGSSPVYRTVSQMPGVDGFTMNVDPLYKVNSGHQWYMQVIYTIGPTDGAPRYKRSIMGTIDKRAAGTSNPNGTNMHPLLLSEDDLGGEGYAGQGAQSNITTIASVLVVVVLVVIVVLFVVGRRRRAQQRREVVRTEPVMANRQRAASKLSLASVKAASMAPAKEEVEMDIQKAVRVSNLNLHKIDNVNRPQVKVKKVNLEVKYQGQNTTEGGTEV